MFDRGEDPVEPAALVLVLSERERCARELLSIEAHRTLLRVVPTDGKGAFLSLALDMVAEAIVVLQV